MATKKTTPTIRFIAKQSDGTKIELAGGSSDKRNLCAYYALMGSRALVDVHAERRRQKEKGHSDAFDDAGTGELVVGAIAVLDGNTSNWPWPTPMKEREGRERLVVAAAMLLAEIDRVDRLAKNTAAAADLLAKKGNV